MSISLRELARILNAVLNEREGREVDLWQLVKTLVVASAKNSATPDIVSVFMDIFGRRKDEIPRELGRGDLASSPLLLMATRNDLKGTQPFVSAASESISPDPRAERIEMRYFFPPFWAY